MCRQSCYHFTDCGFPFVFTTVLGIHKSLITIYWVGTGRTSYPGGTSFSGSSRALRLISTGCKRVLGYHWGWWLGHVALYFCCPLDSVKGCLGYYKAYLWACLWEHFCIFRDDSKEKTCPEGDGRTLWMGFLVESKGESLVSRFLFPLSWDVSKQLQPACLPTMMDYTLIVKLWGYRGDWSLVLWSSIFYVFLAIIQFILYL